MRTPRLDTPLSHHLQGSRAGTGKARKSSCYKLMTLPTPPALLLIFAHFAFCQEAVVWKAALALPWLRVNCRLCGLAPGSLGTGGARAWGAQGHVLIVGQGTGLSCVGAESCVHTDRAGEPGLPFPRPLPV